MTDKCTDPKDIEMGNIEEYMHAKYFRKAETPDKRTETHPCDYGKKETHGEERPLTEDDYAYCAECDHVEMCRWYPMYGCEFKSRSSAQPEPCEDAVSRKAVEEMLKNGFPARGMWEIEGDIVKQTVCETLVDALMDLEKLPSAQPDRSLWFRIGEICVDESKGFISAGRAFEKIRELLREAERRTDEPEK